MAEREHKTRESVVLTPTIDKKLFFAYMEKHKRAHPETFREKVERERREQTRLWGERRSQVFNR